MFVVLAAGFAIRVFTDPELRKALTTSREETTAQLVVKRMREEFGMKPQSQDSEGKYDQQTIGGTNGAHKIVV